MDPHLSTRHESDPSAPRLLLLVASVLWLATGAVVRLGDLSSDDDWQSSYLLYSVLLVASAAVATLAVATYTSDSTTLSTPRLAALALAVVATASTLVAWAFVLWAVLLAAAFAALAGTGSPRRRHAAWLAGALLVGVVIAIVAVNAQLGPPGTYGDHSEAQDWGTTVSCVLSGVGFAVLARRTQVHPASPPMAAT